MYISLTLKPTIRTLLKITCWFKSAVFAFERIVFEISAGNELVVLEHPNHDKYPEQQISMVQVNDYVYALPFVETETEIFLKTIIPSRKAKRQYRRP